MATVVHLAGGDGVLEAAARVRGAAGDDEIVLVVPDGAPVLANPLFLRALQAERPARKLALVTAEARAREMASGAHVQAYASLAAFEQKSLDPTARLERARRAALVEIGRQRGRLAGRRRRALAGLAAALVLLLVLVPYAEVLIATDVRTVGPLDVEVRTQPSGTVATGRLVARLSVKEDAAATGAGVDQTRATGVELFRNASTDSIDLPAGTLVWTSSNVQFRTKESKTLPASRILPIPVINEARVAIEAVEPGPSGNIPRDAITRVGNARLRVTNEQPTGGGEETRYTFVKAADYAAAKTRLDQKLDAAARDQLGRWRALPPAGRRVEDAYVLRLLSETSSGDVVDKRQDSFSLSASAEAIAYAVDAGEPRATALRRLAEGLSQGYEVVPDSETVDAPAVEVTTDVLIWRTRARATQRPRVDENAVRLVLIGQETRAAAPLLAQRGLRVVAVRSSPSWWPRLPLLPMRIDIRSGATAVAP